jgi:hypothetical protein
MDQTDDAVSQLSNARCDEVISDVGSLEDARVDHRRKLKAEKS